MYNSSLVEIIKSFSSSDIKRFDEFLNSPFFNKKPTVIKLWDDLKSFYPEFNSREISKKNIYERIVPGKEYNYGTMKNMIFDLTKLAEIFLSKISGNDSYFDEEYRLLKMFLNKGLKKQFIKTVEKNFKLLKKNKYKYGNFEKLKLLCELCNEHWVFTYSSHKPIDTVKYSYFSFIEIYATCFNNIKVGINDIADKSQLRSEEKIISKLDIENIAGSFIKGNADEEKIITYYLMLVKAYKSPDSIEYYNKAKEYLRNIHELIEPTSLNYCYRLLSNVILNNKTIPLNKRMDKFTELINILINLEIMFPPDKPIGILEFSNVVKLTNDAAVLKKLINDNLKNVLIQNRESMKEYAMAHYYFLTKDYGLLMNTCSKMKFDIFLFKADIKAIQLKALYEMNDFDTFLYQADSFVRTLPKTKKLREEYVTGYINLAEIIKKLFRYKESNDQKYSFEIIKMLNTQKVHSYVWVINRLEEIKKNKN